MDKVISVYWFAILFIIAGAVVYMVGVFYGSPFDVREVEANLLLNHAADCVSQAGIIPAEINDGANFLLTNDNFLELCNLNFEEQDEEYYINVEFYDFNSNQLMSNVDAGNAPLTEFCKEQYKGAKNNPVCVQRSFYALDSKNVQYKIKLISVVKKTEENVR